MQKIDSNIKSIEKYINNKTNSNPDYIFKTLTFGNNKLSIIFCESLCSGDIINDFILEFFEEKKNDSIDSKNMLTYLEENLPTHKVVKIKNYNDLFYNLCSGFTIIAIDGFDEALSIETKAVLNSPVSGSKNETVLKGPNDAFTENYQTNIGLIRKRLKTEKLWIDEVTIGGLSKTKIGILHIKDIASEEMIKHLKEKIEKIDIDAILDGNYVVDTISGNISNFFPTYLSTERPDIVVFNLLEGKIAIVVENSQLVLLLPTLFPELFHNPEDYYQKPSNANYTRAIRYLAFFITLLTPAIYIAITTYNHETIPSSLLVNFSIQRDGVPLPTVLEALLMLLTFEILKETDARIPNAIGSSLSIVGALVLGDAAVTAGIVSPIMVIVIAITSISGFILSYFDVTNGIRWWRMLFLIAATVAGMIGIVIASLIFLLKLTSVKSLGVPYMTPVAPLMIKELPGSIFVTQKSKFLKRPSYLANNNTTRGKDKSK